MIINLMSPEREQGIHTSFGLSNERADQLADQSYEVMRQHFTSDEADSKEANMPLFLKDLAALADNTEELVLLVYLCTLGLAKNGLIGHRPPISEADES